MRHLGALEKRETTGDEFVSTEDRSFRGVELSYLHPHAAPRSFTGARPGPAGQAEIKL